MENINEYCYIMDFSDSSISEIKLNKENKQLKLYELLDKYGFKFTECNFMFTTKRITNINKIHRK